MGRSRSRGRRSRERRDRDTRDRDTRDRDRPKKEASSKPDDDELRPGRQVIVKGLQKNAEKNGSVGSLIEFNKDKGRWVVELSAGRNNFKEENLELLPDNSDVVDDHETPPTAKVYITKLPADTTDKDLIDLFGGVGLIAKEAPKNSRNRGFPDTWPYAVKLYKPGRNDGDACVTYTDPLAAKAAIKTYNRYKFKGSKIGVAYAGQGRKYEEVELQLPWHLREENLGQLDRESGSKGRRPGDWTCPGCGSDVYASKDACFKCGAAKPAGGGGGSR
eukprot:CAMPEP_0117581450 /NCGR_PEP_ID=MMETSP0784-20121206/65832_1 /TAXON_ID=39447 /ORGANISM="" /LENGTH=274 /DNA_ID=CAMNT_0005381759 /DNA_START=71 /DNA_END=895 /DNA_ORIENTATION=-